MKFIIIKKQGLTENKVKISTGAFYHSEFGEVLETVDIDALKDALRVPPAVIDITIKGHYLTEILLKAITPAYLRGTQIVINGVAYPVCTANPQYLYIWQDKVPAVLPEHLKDAYYHGKLYGALYNELVAWNQERIAKASSASKFKWILAEDFYKVLYKSLTPKGIRVCSPNKKTFYESVAELAVENYLEPQSELTADEKSYLDIAELKHYIQAFGLQSTTLKLGTKHRTTPHGTTEEPCIVSDFDIEMAITAQSFNRKDNRELQGYRDESGFEVKMWTSACSKLVTSHKRERENIETLKWFLSLPKATQEEFLLPGWKFCPVCGKLYHESDGCDGHIEPVEFVPYNENHDDEEDFD